MESAQKPKKRGHKEARKANFLKKIWKGDQSAKASSFLKRKPTLMKKAMELSTLCDVDATVICYDANGGVDFWPPDLMEVNKRCFNYLGLKDKEKKELDYLGLVESKKRKLMKKKGKMSVDALISGLSNRVEDQESVIVLESKIKKLKERIEFLKEKGRQIVQCQESDYSVEDLMIIGETKASWLENKGSVAGNGRNGDFGFEFGGHELGLVNYGINHVPLNMICMGKDSTMGMVDYSDGQSFYSNWLIPSDCIASGQY